MFLTIVEVEFSLTQNQNHILMGSFESVDCSIANISYDICIRSFFKCFAESVHMKLALQFLYKNSVFILNWIIVKI